MSSFFPSFPQSLQFLSCAGNDSFTKIMTYFKSLKSLAQLQNSDPCWSVVVRWETCLWRTCSGSFFFAQGNNLEQVTRNNEPHHIKEALLGSEFLCNLSLVDCYRRQTFSAGVSEDRLTQSAMFLLISRRVVLKKVLQSFQLSWFYLDSFVQVTPQSGGDFHTEASFLYIFYDWHLYFKRDFTSVATWFAKHELHKKPESN